jgi:hypothetical protein
MSIGTLNAAMENKIFNMYVRYCGNIGEAQKITKYIKDNDRLGTWFGVHPQIIELNKKRILSYSTDLYIKHLDDILEEYPQSIFKLPSLDWIESFEG